MKKLQSLNEFQAYIKKHRTEKRINLFFDIETLQYNEAKGRIKPSLYKNVTYSCAVGWLNDEVDSSDEILYHTFASFSDFFDNIIEACTTGVKKKITSCKAIINLIAHNNNKYDNHYLLNDLIFLYPDLIRENMFIKNSTDHSNSVKLSDLQTKEDKQYLTLEKRVKSSINLDLDFFIQGIRFSTIDNFVKTNTSIATLGKKLLNLGKITKDELKTSFDYTKYNKDEDMTELQARDYAQNVFKSLDEDQHIYIRNDVIILGKAFKYYDKLFPNFDYSKFTFTSNILEFYKTNNLTTFQLLNEIGEKKEKVKIRYTDYKFSDENLYDYLKSFYRGGLNFYNSNYVGKHLTGEFFSIDLNSSYPAVMYGNKVPTFFTGGEQYNRPTKHTLDLQDDVYYMYRITKEYFNKEILACIESRILKQMLVKYYTTNEYVNINSYTMRMINNYLPYPIKEISILSYVSFECVDFGAKDKIFENYIIKTQGKLANKIDMKDPYTYEILDIINSHVLTPEEVDISKVYLNGLYGIPALKAYFNLFKLMENHNEIENVQNGFKNNERNIVFSTFVTSVSLYNLLEPLKYLTHEEIDEAFVYCDTDSLYMKKSIKHKLPPEMFDPISLGKWDIECETITDMYVLNHKKYAYYCSDLKKGKEKGISIRCGGIPLDSFDTDMTFKKFITTQFYHGANVPNTKSIHTVQGNIAIYESVTSIEKGKDYPIFFSYFYQEERENIIEEIKNDYLTTLEDFMYIETEYGTLSETDIYPHFNPTENKQNVQLLASISSQMKNLLNE